MKRHQEFLAKVKNIPDFTKEPFGNPFESDELQSLVSVVGLDATTVADEVEDDKTNYEEADSEEVGAVSRNSGGAAGLPNFENFIFSFLATLDCHYFQKQEL